MKKEERKIKFKITSKYYSKQRGKFVIVKEEVGNKYNIVEECYDEFNDFYNAAHKNLNDTDLFEMNFDCIDIGKYNFSGASLPSKIEVEANLYSNSFFNEIQPREKNKILCKVPKKERIPKNYHLNPIHHVSFRQRGCFYCISNLDLDTIIHEKYPDYINRRELKKLIKHICEEIYLSTKHSALESWLAFSGNITSNLKVFEMFIECYHNTFHPNYVFFVLGEKELSALDDSNTVEEKIEIYRSILFKYRFGVLNDQICVPCSYLKLPTYEELNLMSDEEIIERFKFTNFAFMASSNLSEDNKINLIHKKLSQLVPECNIFVITNKSPNKWLNGDKCPNWIYLNNEFDDSQSSLNTGIEIYNYNPFFKRDNAKGLRSAFFNTYVDSFKDYDDGVHKINARDYNRYGYRVGMSFSFNRDFKNMYLVKRGHFYVFAIESNNGSLSMLNGGNLSKIDDKGLEYFYEYLPDLENPLEVYLNEYTSYLEKISQGVKQIGGKGIINGAYVELNEETIIYVNPITFKHEYVSFDDDFIPYRHASIYRFLEHYDKKLFDNYINVFDKNKNILINVGESDIDSTDVGYKIADDIFMISKIIEGLKQSNLNIQVRKWTDSMFDLPPKERGQLILSNLLWPSKYFWPNIKGKGKK